MKRVVYKYELPGSGLQEVTLRKGAEILAIYARGKSLMMWALADPDAHWVMRKFFIVAQGEVFDMHWTWRYIGTYFIDNATWVYHVWEIL